jgi:hypothetical protein
MCVLHSEVALEIDLTLTSPQTPAAEEGFPLSLANSTHMRRCHPAHFRPIGSRSLSLVCYSLHVICSADLLLWTGLEVCLGQRRHLLIFARGDRRPFCYLCAAVVWLPASQPAFLLLATHVPWCLDREIDLESAGAKSAEPHERDDRTGA